MLLKTHLLLAGCVVIRFKVRAYYRVRCVFKSAYALPTNKIWAFKSIYKVQKYCLKTSFILLI